MIPHHCFTFFDRIGLSSQCTRKKGTDQSIRNGVENFGSSANLTKRSRCMYVVMDRIPIRRHIDSFLAVKTVRILSRNKQSEHTNLAHSPQPDDPILLSLSLKTTTT